MRWSKKSGPVLRLKTLKSWCCARQWKRNWPSCRPRIRPNSWLNSVQTEPGLNRLIRRRLSAAGPADLSLPPAPRKSAPGRSARVRPPRRRPDASHTDFEKGFIRAEVTAYDDYIAARGETGAKAAGKLRLERTGIHRPRRRCDAFPLQRLRWGGGEGEKGRGREG